MRAGVGDLRSRGSQARVGPRVERWLKLSRNLGQIPELTNNCSQLTSEAIGAIDSGRRPLIVDINRAPNSA